jgi:CRISPR-associated protein Cas2
MILWVLYDIENDRARNRVAKFCKQAGLHRVQYSCFLGVLDATELDVLQLQINAEINAHSDKAYLFPMERSSLKATVLLGQAFDKKLVTDQVKALFF